jgi:non-homologous end joining protein Ku
VASTHTRDMKKLVLADEFDRRHYDNAYIEPAGKAGEEAFAVIRDAT